MSRPGDLVLDPYCGSGTTLLEAALLGRRAYGVDLNPLAVLIARAKVTPVPAADLGSLQEELKHALAPLESEDLPLFRALSESSIARAKGQSDARVNDPWFRKWFQPKVLLDLIAIDSAIERIDGAARQNVARVAFSDILRKCSNAHSGYPNVMFDKNAPERSRPIKPFLATLRDVCNMVAALEKTGARWEDVRVELGNAVALRLEDCSVDFAAQIIHFISSN